MPPNSLMLQVLNVQIQFLDSSAMPVCGAGLNTQVDSHLSL